MFFAVPHICNLYVEGQPTRKLEPTLQNIIPSKKWVPDPRIYRHMTTTTRLMRPVPGTKPLKG